MKFEIDISTTCTATLRRLSSHFQTSGALNAEQSKDNDITSFPYTTYEILYSIF